MTPFNTNPGNSPSVPPEDVLGDEIDAFIDGALRWDHALVPAPPTLREGIAQRIRYAQMRKRERSRFRSAAALLVGGAAASFAAVGTATLYAMAQPASALGLPGVGALEYHLAHWAAVWRTDRAEVLLFLGAAAGVVVLLAGILPLGRRLLNN